MFQKIKSAIQEWNAAREYKRYIPVIHQLTQGLNAHALVDFVMNTEWKRFYWLIQIPSEIKWLLSQVEELKPKVVVEIGTRMGGTLFLFTKMAAHDAKVVSIDFPDGHGGGYKKSRECFYKSFAQPPQQLHLIKGDSHKPTTREALLTILNGKPIDFLFIDGDHSYEGVKLDYEMYGSLVRPGGIIAFHDNKPTSDNQWSGVIPFWEELEKQAQTSKFFGEEDSWGGMGVVNVPTKS